MSGSKVLHPLALLDVDVRASGQSVLAGLTVVAGEKDLAVLLRHVAVLHAPVDLGGDRRLLRPTLVLDYSREEIRLANAMSHRPRHAVEKVVVPLRFGHWKGARVGIFCYGGTGTSTYETIP